MKVTISGFYDEVSLKLDKQIALLNELGEKYMCPRMLDGKNIADYTLEEFVSKFFQYLVAILLGIAIFRHKEAEHSYVFAVHNFANLNQFFKLF